MENASQDPYADAAMPAEEPKQTETTSKTALLPKSFCPGMKPGDVIPCKVTRELGEEYEVAYEGGEEEAEPEEAPAPSAPARGEMESMMG